MAGPEGSPKGETLKAAIGQGEGKHWVTECEVIRIVECVWCMTEGEEGARVCLNCVCMCVVCVLCVCACACVCL